MSEKETHINEILDIELKMFRNVRSRYPVSCQRNQEGFRMHRGSQFSAWSVETLVSYRGDLLNATEQKKNLMTLKYARMEGIIPPLNESPVIDEIVDLEMKAQKEMSKKYPNILDRGRPLIDDSSRATSFLTYLKGELETYSEHTLELLLKDIKKCRDTGRNWAETVYEELVNKLGYKSMDHAEESIIHRNKQE